MSRALREHARDFIAIVALFVFALVTVLYILVNQRADFPDWIPGLGEDRFELKAEMTSSQAVTPGQGQSVNIAGIRVGSITDVEVSEGKAVVSMEIENEHASVIREDATFLLRPRTGLQDMVLEVDAGDPSSPAIEEGATVPSSQTSPNVNPDEVLASLDADTRDFLRLLLADGSRALDGNEDDLAATFKRFEPTARDIAKFQGALASRRENLSRVIHNFGLLTEELGRRDDQLRNFVSSSDAVLGAFANQEAAIQESLRELPSTLEATRASLESSNEFSAVLGPAARDLTPAAQALAPALRATRPLFRDTVDPIREQIRPFTTEVTEPVRHLNQAAKGLADSTPALTSGIENLNILFNELAYNPPGAQDEGFLFWVAWLNHNGNQLFTLSDAHGPMIRGLVLVNCGTITLANGVALARPYLATLQEGTNVPRSEDICPEGGLFPRDALEEFGAGGAETPDDEGAASAEGETDAEAPEDSEAATTSTTGTTETATEPEPESAEPPASEESTTTTTEESGE